MEQIQGEGQSAQMLSASDVPAVNFINFGSWVGISRKEGEPPRMDLLPNRIYTVECDIQRGYFLTPQANFEMPPKLYGKTTDQAARILKAFSNQKGNMGVLLEGLKGSGKTMLSRLICESGRSGLNMPVLLVNSAFCGPAFFNFLQMIQQECIVLFDEFEKVYDSDDQEKMLSLLDGVFQSRKLFVLTCNDTYRINEHMKNRPGRIRYRLTFRGLGKDFITEYVDDKLIHKARREQVITVALLFGDSMNFDMLQALVKEVNDFNEEPAKSLEYLNARPVEVNFSRRYIVTVIDNKGVNVPLINSSLETFTKEWVGNPLDLGGQQESAMDSGVLTLEDQHGEEGTLYAGKIGVTISTQAAIAYGLISKKDLDKKTQNLKEVLSKMGMADYPIDFSEETGKKLKALVDAYQEKQEEAKETKVARAASVEVTLALNPSEREVSASKKSNITTSDVVAVRYAFIHQISVGQDCLCNGSGVEGKFVFFVKKEDGSRSDLFLQFKEKPYAEMTMSEMIRRSYGGEVGPDMLA